VAEHDVKNLQRRLAAAEQEIIALKEEVSAKYFTFAVCFWDLHVQAFFLNKIAEIVLQNDCSDCNRNVRSAEHYKVYNSLMPTNHTGVCYKCCIQFQQCYLTLVDHLASAR